MTYTDAWHDLIDPGARRSASVVLPVIHGLVSPDRAVDVGCGRGAWGSVLAGLGCAEVVGVERDAATVIAPGVRPVSADLTDLEWNRGKYLGSFDLALCLEVGEHLPEACADGLVGWLCELAPAVLFSAATPGQGGEGHVNEQWPGYWARRFGGYGYDVTAALRWQFWHDERVDPWYSQNLLLALNETSEIAGKLDYLLDAETAEAWPVVHPRIAAAMLAARP